MPKDEIEFLIYPNAIHEIAQRSTKHSEADRKIKKQELLRYLKQIRKTIISKWTLGLKSYDKLMKERYKQLKINLSKNLRLRHIIIKEDSLDDFDDGIVTFTEDFLNKYHFKTNKILYVSLMQRSPHLNLCWSG